MSFSGKATYSSGATLPEIAEDVSDLVSIVSPYETPLLDALGDPMRVARSTVHEWLEDELLPNFDIISGAITDGVNQTALEVAHVNRFRSGDQLRAAGSRETMLVVTINVLTATITVVRGYGGSTREALATGAELRIIGNAALEGDAADAARFTARSRKQNYTQIFSATVEVSGSELASQQLGVADEMNYQKQLRIRELLRDMENSVINGRAAAVNPAGTSTTRRTMNGLISMIITNYMRPGIADMPAGEDVTEEMLNTALRTIWMNSGSPADLILVSPTQKRQINGFMSASRRYAGHDERFSDLVNVYESDFGVCRVVLNRYVPTGSVLLLNSSHIDVLPLSGRSFFYKPLATSGDRESGQIIGEYTLELRNENAHGMISGLGA